jgi:hypothetical protein
MSAGLGDHLWQSGGFFTAICLLVRMLRRNAPVVRLWLWRIAALKFLFPFALLFALGGWCGWPVTHTSEPAPAVVVRIFAALRPFTSPAQRYELTGGALLTALLGGLACAVACAWHLREQLAMERRRVHDEAERCSREGDEVTPPTGFFKAATLTAFALCTVSLPLIAGAVDDQGRRLERLKANARALRHAVVDLKPAKPGFGLRFRLAADANGVFIRNVSIHDLVAMAYGVNRYAVSSDQMYTEADASGAWMHWPRYDLRVHAPLPFPGDFDPYALQQIVTLLLAERFELQIFVNKDCQPPCGRYRMPVPE